MHKDLLVGIHKKCIDILHGVIDGNIGLTAFSHGWSRYAIVKLAFLFHNSVFFDIEYMKKLLAFSANDGDSLGFISFQVFKAIDSDRSSVNKDKAKHTLLALSHLIEYNEQEYFTECKFIRHVVKELIAYLKPSEIKSLNDAFSNLRLFFENRHPGDKHNEMINQIAYLRTRIRNKLVSETGQMESAIRLIVEILKDEIMDPLNKIREFRLFKDIPENEAGLLFGARSVYTGLFEILSDYERLIRIDEKEGGGTKFDAIKVFTERLTDFQFRYLKGDSFFYQFCKKYPANLHECIESAWEQAMEGEMNNYNITCRNLIDTNLFVNIHMSYLEYGLIELMKNAIKEPKNEDAIITFSTKEDDEKIKFILFQDKPFIERPDFHEGGIKKYVLPMFENFCGKDNISFDLTLPDSFIIQINLIKNTV